MGTSGQREGEAEARETEGTRAQGAHGSCWMPGRQCRGRRLAVVHTE